MPRRRLRTRLALLYGGLFLAASAAALIVADLPVVTFRKTSRARAGGLPGHTGAATGSNLHQVLGYSGIALAAAAVLAAALGWLAADPALRPLRAITRSAREISASNLHERLGLNASYDEFTELGETLDDLFRRLEASFEAQRRFVANASHELRLYSLVKMAFALRDPQTGTVPIASANYFTANAGDAVLWNRTEALALFNALQNDQTVPKGLLGGTTVG
jgi:HAMP domain-containing protein